MVNYFFDSYAIIELVKGNPRYVKYIQEDVTITLFNLAEIYWSFLNDLGEEAANNVYSKYESGVEEIDENVLKDAMKFRKLHKKKNLSYTDCIGYTYAIRHDLIFLTGDKEFEHFANVEFVK